MKTPLTAALTKNTKAYQKYKSRNCEFERKAIASLRAV